MVKVTTMLYVTKNGEVSDEITNSFQERFDVWDIMRRLAETEEKHIEIGPFSVDLIMAELDRRFLMFLFQRGMATGLIYCASSRVADMMPEDLLEVLGEDVKVIFKDKSGAFCGDQVQLGLKNYNITNLTFDLGYCFAEVEEVSDYDSIIIP